MLGTLLDAALDFAVVPGYTKVGYGLRARGFADLGRMDGRTVLVTGATSGLGTATARGFASLGARVLVLARDRDRGERAAARLRAQTGGDVVVVDGDLASLRSIRRAADRLTRDEHRLDVLVHNAGVMAQSRTLSGDGIELTFATNVVGPFLLTELVRDLLAAHATAAEPGRIVTVSSGGMYTAKLDVDDPQTARRDYDGPGAYARAKRAQVVLTELWARRLVPRHVVAHAMHPGWAATPGVTEALPRFNAVMGPLLRSPEQGADTTVWLGAATAPTRSTGGFWHDRRRRPVHRVPWTRESDADRERLWTVCRELARVG